MCLAIPGRIVEVITDPVHLAMVDVSGVRRKPAWMRPAISDSLISGQPEYLLYVEGEIVGRRCGP